MFVGSKVLPHEYRSGFTHEFEIEILQRSLLLLSRHDQKSLTCSSRMSAVTTVKRSGLGPTVMHDSRFSKFTRFLAPFVIIQHRVPC